jgi:nucleotide-binding universal stress UspA family protein
LAVQWADWYQASIKALGVVDLPRLTAPEAVPLGAGPFKVRRDEAMVKAAEQRISSLLADFQARCADARVFCQALKLEGDPANLLMREAQSADLLVVGKKSASEVSGLPISHTLHHVLRHSPRPVLCVPVVSSPSTPVLVAYDGSPQAAKALQAFQAIGLASRRCVHILTVTTDSAHRRFGELATEYLRLHGHEAHAHFESSHASPDVVILAEAKRLHVGLVVMGCHAKPLLKELFLGSVASAVLKHSSLPVLLYH